MRRRRIAVILAGVALSGCGGEREEERPASAATPSATPAATTIPMTESDGPIPERRRFRSIGEAVKAVDRLVDVPVVLPANLPAGAKIAGAGGTPGRGYITLGMPQRRALHIQYGKAGFDGCGPNARATTVGGAPAVIDAGEGSRPPAVTLVWPATVKRPTGRYGLSGQFPKARILAWAESMQQRARAAGPGRHTPGC